jgi:hypothetical protein
VAKSPGELAEFGISGLHPVNSLGSYSSAKHGAVPGPHPRRREIVVGFLDFAAEGQKCVPPLPFGFWRNLARQPRGVGARLVLELAKLYTLAPEGGSVLALIGKMMATAAREMRRGI